MSAEIIPMLFLKPKPTPIREGSAMIIGNAEAEIYEAAVDLESEIRQARTVDAALRLFHTVQPLVLLLQKLELLALEQADAKCGGNA